MELTKEQEKCDHGVIFDEELAKTINDPWEVRRLFPRLDGECPKGCGFYGAAYASFLHYVSGDW
jgi:hypothetical protein